MVYAPDHLGPPEPDRRRARHVWPRADELLWRKLNENLLLVTKMRAKHRDAQAGELLDHCDNLLRKAEHSLTVRRWDWLYARNSDLFWTTVHQVDEELVSIMDRSDLAAAAEQAHTDFKRTITDPPLVARWLGEDGLPATLKRLRARWYWKRNLSRDRRTVRAAMATVNNRVDRKFWQLAMNARIKVLSAFELLALMGLLLIVARPLYWLVQVDGRGPLVPLEGLWLVSSEAWSRAGLVGLLALGAAGALLSNMISKRSFHLSYGPTQASWAALYYMIVVPVAGAAAGLVLVALTRSHLVLALGPVQTMKPAPPVQIALDEGARPFAYMLIATVGGFLGHRVLARTIERVYRIMFKEASKDIPSDKQSKPTVSSHR